VVTTFAGSAGTPGTNDGPRLAASFNHPLGVAVDSSNNVFVADSGNHTIRKITPAGEVTTLAGSAGIPGTNDNLGADARFNNPIGVAVDAAGNVFVADNGNLTIRKITPAGVVTTLAGRAGFYGTVDGTGADARFYDPKGLTADIAGNVIVIEVNGTVRKVTQAGVVTTMTDGAGQLFGPQGVAVNRVGVLYLADSWNNRIVQGLPSFNYLLPVITVAYGRTNLILSWLPSYLGWELQAATNLSSGGAGTNWSAVPNTTNLIQISLPINPQVPAQFYRLRSP
jgi:streptogramin lyase